MKVYVINLTESSDRRKKMESILEPLNIPYSFYITDRIDNQPEHIIYKLYNHKKALLLKGYGLTNSELGCWASHLELWNKCIELNEPILIMEDNACFTVLDANLFLEEISREIHTYNLVKLGGSFKKDKYTEFAQLKHNPSYSLVSYNKGNCGMYGYMLTPYAAKKLIKNIDNFFEPVDNYMENEWRTKQIVYIVHPPLVQRDNVVSNIGTRKKDKSILSLKNIYSGYKKTRQFLFNRYKKAVNVKI